MTKKSLTTKDILQKEFKKGMRRYDATEVDEFLDLVIRDYESYNKDLTILREENERLLKQVNALTEELVSSQKAAPAAPAAGVTNFDILKRISNLEKHVFGARLNEVD